MPFDLEKYFNIIFANCIRDEADLHDYQVFAVDWLKRNKFAALFIDVGLGKTIIVLTLLDWLIQRGYARKILIIAPIKVCNRVWGPEIRAWFHTAYIRHHNLRIEDDDPRLLAEYSRAYADVKKKGASPALAVKLAKECVTALKMKLREQQLDNPAQVHIINQEAVAWLVDQWAARGREWPYAIIVFDESSRLRDHASEVFKKLRQVRKSVIRFIQLTATPAAQTYMYLFSQIWLLDEGERFGSRITPFREQYFTQNPYTRAFKLRPGAEVEIEAKISDICLIMRRKDYRDFEEPKIIVKPVHLPPKIAAKYREFEKNAVLEPEDDSDLIVAENGGALSTKLLQLASGAVYDADGKYHVFHSEKIEALKEIREQALDQTLLVAYWFKSSLDRLRKAFPKAAVMDRAGRKEEGWNKGKYKMMLVHPAGVGHGLNLQHGGHHLVIFDLFWSLELFLQLIGRLDRQGQVYPVIVHLISTVGTHDAVVSANLEVLKDAQEAMFTRLQALRKRMKER